MADKTPNVVSSGDEPPVSESSVSAPNPGAPGSETPVAADLPLDSGSASSSAPEQISPQTKSPSPVHSAESDRKSSSPTRNDKEQKASKSPDKEPESSAGNDIAESNDTMGSPKDRSPSASDKPAPPAKHSTMVATAKEAQALLKDQRLGETRSTTKTLKQASDTSAESSPKKAPVKRDHTIQATIKEAAGIIGADVDSLPEKRSLRSSTKKAEEPPKPTRNTTMKRTAEEGKALLGDAPLTKRTRGGK